MFGGYGIFHEGKMFALIKGSGLFFKVDNSNLSEYEKAGSQQFRPMPYYKVPQDVFADPGTLRNWAGKSIEIAHLGSEKKKKK
jgi:DNA transformation protein